MQHFQFLLRKAVDNGYLDHNVVKDVEREPSQVPDDRFRTHEEIQKMIASGHLLRRRNKTNSTFFNFLQFPNLKNL